MTREDRAKEAEECRAAATQEVYRYKIESIKILNDGAGVLDEIAEYVNKTCLSGYRLHTIEITPHAVVYCVFERLETVRV